MDKHQSSGIVRKQKQYIKIVKEATLKKTTF